MQDTLVSLATFALSYREVVHTSGIYDGVGVDLRQGSPVTPVTYRLFAYEKEMGLLIY